MEVAKVVIETKGNWHRDLWAAMRTQLVDRYLAPSAARHGLYLVGWFTCSSWNNPGDRRNKRAGSTRAEAQRRLEAEALKLSVSGIQVRAVVLNTGLRPGR